MSNLRTVLLLIPALFLASCTAEKTATPKPTTPEPGVTTPDSDTIPSDTIPKAPSADEVQVTDALIGKLEKADAQDGTTDNVVANCPGCKLGMAGNADHITKVGGYTLHFCNGCIKRGTDKDPIAVLTALKVDG